MSSLVRLFCALAGALALSVVISASQTARAAAFNVDSTADASDASQGDGACATSAGACTLRAAIQEANALAGDDTITLSVAGTISLSSALPDLLTNIAMAGPGSSQLTVRRDTGGDYRILTVGSGATVSVSGLTLTNGKTAAGASGSSGADGGGVFNSGTLSLTDVTVTANSTGDGGNATSFGGNGGGGGGVYNSGTLTMTDCLVSANATGRGGDGVNSSGYGGRGGGVYNTNTLTMTDCVVDANTTGRSGDSSGIVNAGGSGGGIYSETGTLVLTNLTVSNNRAGNGGTGSSANPGGGGNGGGIYIGTGSATLTDSTVSGNSAGLSTGGSAGYAGGIENRGGLTITGSTVSGNTGGEAGGIMNRLALTMINSTVSGNTGPLDKGDGIFSHDSASSLKLTNCTIAENTRAGVNANNVIVRNTIIARNGGGPGGGDASGSYTSQGHNLVGVAEFNSGFGAAGDQLGSPGAPLNPRLGPLAANGGPTLTHALLPGSPALDAGDNSLALDAAGAALVTDQRGAGFARFVDSLDADATATVDIGALESYLLLEDVTDQTTNEDTFASIPFSLRGQIGMSASSDNLALVPAANYFFLVTSQTTRTLQITPAPDQFGTATITLTVYGPQGETLSDTFLLTVNSVNDTPTFTKGSDPDGSEDAGPQTILNWATGISAGPSNESGQTLFFEITNNTNPGLFSAGPSVSPGGTLTFTPAANKSGAAFINIRLRDNGGGANGGLSASPEQTFNIYVREVNDKPVANGQSVTTGEDAAKVILLTGSDTENAITSFTVTSGPSHGTITGTGFTGSGASRTYTPHANYSGTDSFKFKVTDHAGDDSAEATVSITVSSVNDAPSFAKGLDQTVAEDAGAQTVLSWANGISPGPSESGQTLSFLVTGNTNPGLFSAGPSVSPGGTLTFTPAANKSGAATISIVLKDNGGTAGGGHDTAAAQSFVINVNAVNDSPAANGQAVTTDEDTAKAITLTGSDTEGSALTFTVTSGPSHGTINGTGASRTYTPAANYSGTDSFKFKANDGQADSAEATVTVSVNAVNDAPVNSVPGAQATNQHTPLVFSAANANAVSVSDVDAAANPVRVTLSATHGTLTLGATAGLTFTAGDGANDAAMTFDGTTASINAALAVLTFKPGAGFSGAAGLQLTTDDRGRNGSGGIKSDADAVAITVRAGGTLQFSGPTYEADEDGGTAAITVTRTGGNAGAASINFAASGGTAAGGAACGAGVDYVNTSGTLSWADGEAGSKTFSVTVCDNSLHEADEALNLTLSGAAGSATLGAPSAAALTIHDEDAAGGVFEFTQSAYAVGEGAGLRIVTIRRSGDATQAASVDYATDDGSTPAVSVPCSSTSGLALDRCDFTRALGTLQFAAGETEKTFTVLITDDSYVEGAETASLVLSNPGGAAALGAQATAALEITDDVPETSGNTSDDDGEFVRAHYHDFLNREPDDSGFQFWTDNIAGCGTNHGCREVKRVDTSAAFFLSVEFQETGFLVYRAYKAAYGDLPGKPVPLTLAEFLPDTQAISQGVEVNVGDWAARLEQNKELFAADFAARPRFAAAYPSAMTPAQFVDALNANTGGSLSPAERDALVHELTAGTKTRAQALRAAAEDADFDAREKNRAFVLMQYFGYLRRNPDDAPEPGLNFDGYNFWLGKLNQFGGNFRAAEMVKAFITSTEYRARFGQP